MIPAVNVPPSTAGRHTEPCGFSGKDSGNRRWQGAQARPRFSDEGGSWSQGRPDRRQPPAVSRSVRATLSDQQEAQVKRGVGLLKKAPQEALAIARMLHQMVPNTISAYELETRALLQLGRYRECLAVMERPLCGRASASLRMTRGRALQELGRLDEAEVEFRTLYERYARTAQHKKVNGLALGRLLQRMGGQREQEALALFTQIRQLLAGAPDTPCEHYDVELTLARHLQHMGGRAHLHKALGILTGLRRTKAGNRPDTPCADRSIEIALARLLEDLGGEHGKKAYTIWVALQHKIPRKRDGKAGHDREIELGLAISLNKMATPESRTDALALLTAMRRRAAGNKANTPCDDRDIELVRGIVLQEMGGLHNREQALAVFTRLRRRAAAGRPDTPCADKAIEQALSRYWQTEGGRDSQQKSLAILTEIRKKAAGNRVGTPCDDKDIELALGILRIQMGGEENLKQALAIFTRLRTLCGSKDPHQPCDNKDIEFPLAGCLTQLHDWPAFDRWNRERPLLQGTHELELIQSIRYFTEFLIEDHGTKPRPELLDRALRHARVAVEKSGGLYSANLSQLGHCYRVLADSPYQPDIDIVGLKVARQEAIQCAQDCFDKALQIAPQRADRSKDQLWRQWQRAWLTQVKEVPLERFQEACRVRDPYPQGRAPQSEQELSL